MLYSAHHIASFPFCIVVIGEMASAWLTLQQHALDISTLAPAHSTPKGAQPLHTHHHPTGETNTHVIWAVDVGLGFDQCDDSIGMALQNSLHQRRKFTLRTRNDTERQSKCAGIPHMTRTLFLALMSALASISAMAISVRRLRAALVNGVKLLYEHTMILRDSPSVRAYLI